MKKVNNLFLSAIIIFASFYILDAMTFIKGDVVD